MKPVLSSNGSCISGNSSVPKIIEVGFMTIISAYMELLIRGKSPGEMPGGKCPDTSMPLEENVWSRIKRNRIEQQKVEHTIADEETDWHSSENITSCD